MQKGLSPEILREGQKAQGDVDEQPKHEQGAKLSIVDEGISYKIQRPTNLPFGTGLGFGLQELGINLQKGRQCQEHN